MCSLYSVYLQHFRTPSPLGKGAWGLGPNKLRGDYA